MMAASVQVKRDGQQNMYACQRAGASRATDVAGSGKRRAVKIIVAGAAVQAGLPYLTLRPQGHVNQGTAFLMQVPGHCRVPPCGGRAAWL